MYYNFISCFQWLHSSVVSDNTQGMLAEALGTPLTENGLQQALHQLSQWTIDMGGRLIGAVLIFIIGRFLIGLVRRLLRKFLDAREIDNSVKSFVMSMVKVLLFVLLVVAIVGKLGIETTSIAALLASIGLAVGMAFSGNLQNFASGIIILLFKPYRIGDVITAQDLTGTVTEIQIFHTIMRTYLGELIYIPNNLMMSNALTNITHLENRLIELTIGVDYGTDMAQVRTLLLQIIAEDNRILTDPAPTVALGALADSSVNITVRVTVRNEDYVTVRWALNETIYKRFNEEGIDFPFPQLTVHQATN